MRGPFIDQRHLFVIDPIIRGGGSGHRCAPAQPDERNQGNQDDEFFHCRLPQYAPRQCATGTRFECSTQFCAVKEHSPLCYSVLMRVDGKLYRSIWADASAATVSVIDQTLLPHRFAVRKLRTVAEAAAAICDMRVRGAPLIGATAAYGIALAMRTDASDANIEAACTLLACTRPTAVNLRHALRRI